MSTRFPNVVRDSDGYAPPKMGGGIQVRRKAFAYNTSGIGSGITLFYLPEGAEIIDQELIVQTAFNAGTTNTLDFGTVGALTRYAAALAAGSAARVSAGFDVSQFAAALAAKTPYTVRYNQTGTAASAGAGLVIVKFWMPPRGT